MKILITAPYFQPVPLKYSDILNQHHIEFDMFEVEEKCFESDLIPIIHKYDGVIAGDDHFTSAVFEKAIKLKVISKWGTGIDSIDLKSAKKHGVNVLYTADAFIRPVAETVFGYILSFARNIHIQNTLMKKVELIKRLIQKIFLLKILKKHFSKNISSLIQLCFVKKKFYLKINTMKISKKLKTMNYGLD